MSLCEYTLTLVEGPTVEPVDIDYLKANEFMKDIDLDDVYTETFFTRDIIPAARQFIEDRTNRKLLTQTWDMTFDRPQSFVKFPYGRLQSVDSVTIYDEDNDAAVESPSLYSVKPGDNGELWLNSGAVWATIPRKYNSFVIRFVCGWETPAEIPKSIIDGMMMAAATMYYRRENDAPTTALNETLEIEKLYVI